MFSQTNTRKRARQSEQASDQAATPLHAAAALGDLEGVKRILRNHNRGFSVDAIDKDGHTAVWYAIWQGHVAVARTLLKNTFCPCAFPADARDQSGRSAAEIAKFYGLTNDPQSNLFQQPAAPAKCGVTTELHRIVLSNAATASEMKYRLDRLKQLLMDPDVDVDAVNEDGYTALFLASYLNRTDEMLALLHRGANKDFVSPNKQVESPYEWVSTRGSDKMKEIMGVPQNGLRR